MHPDVLPIHTRIHRDSQEWLGIKRRNFAIIRTTKVVMLQAAKRAGDKELSAWLLAAIKLVPSPASRLSLHPPASLSAPSTSFSSVFTAG